MSVYNKILHERGLRLLGGIVGWGTLACALCLGPFVHFFNKHISEPFCQVPKNEPEPFENAEENGKSA